MTTLPDLPATIRWGELWEEIVFRALKRGETEKFGVELANHTVGKNWAARQENARTGRLDEVSKLVTEMAFANAKKLEAEPPSCSVPSATKNLLTDVKSPSVDACDCCGEPIYDPAHQLARTISATALRSLGRMHKLFTTKSSSILGSSVSFWCWPMNSTMPRGW